MGIEDRDLETGLGFKIGSGIGIQIWIWICDSGYTHGIRIHDSNFVILIHKWDWDFGLRYCIEIVSYASMDRFRSFGVV